MKHLPDLLTLRHRHPLFRLSVRPFQDLSPSSTFTSVSILINYNSTTTIIPCMTHLPDLQTWQVHWPSDLDLHFALHWLTYVDVPDLLNYKAYSYQILRSASPRCTESAGTLTRWPWTIFCAPVTEHFASMFDISSTIRPTTIKPCKVLLNVLTQQIPLHGDLDLYFGCSDFDIIYVNVPDLKWKTSSHQTSPRCTDLARTLTRWPWPIFCAPVPSTQFTSTFNISSTIRPTTIKPRVVFLLNVRTP